MIILLKLWEKTTTFLSSALYPTIADIHFYFTELLKHFDYYIGEEDFRQNIVALSLYQKLEEYWVILHENSIIPTILDPGTKLFLIESGEESALAISKIKDQMNAYKTTIPYEKISCDFCPKNIQLKIRRFLYDLPCNKRAKFCNKSYRNHTEKTSDFFDQKSSNFCQI